MHPGVRQYVKQFAREARKGGSGQSNLSPVEILFLEEVWGPAFQFNFEGLKVERQAYSVFFLPQQGARVMIEIYDGDSGDEAGTKHGEDEQLLWQNDLILTGWMILRFSARQIERCALLCRKQLKRALPSRDRVPALRPDNREKDVWELRKRIIVQMAAQHNGAVSPRQVAAEFNVSIRSAAEWLRRFAVEGMLSLTMGNKKAAMFYLNDFAR